MQRRLPTGRDRPALLWRTQLVLNAIETGIVNAAQSAVTQANSVVNACSMPCMSEKVRICYFSKMVSC